jgi:hypothetical protein
MRPIQQIQQNDRDRQILPMMPAHTNKPSTTRGFAHDGLTVAHIQKGVTVAHINQDLGNAAASQGQGSTSNASQQTSSTAQTAATSKK